MPEHADHPERRKDDPRLRRIEEIVEDIRDDQRRFYRLLYGSNGVPGVLTKLDRVEQTVARWKTHIAILWGAIAAAVIGWFSRGGNP